MACATSVYDTYYWDTGMEKIAGRSKKSNWIDDHFSLTLVKLALA